MNEYELKINMIAQEMIEFSEGISWFNSLQKDAQIRPLTAYMRLLHYTAKLAWAYIKYPDGKMKT